MRRRSLPDVVVLSLLAAACARPSSAPVAPAPIEVEVTAPVASAAPPTVRDAGPPLSERAVALLAPYALTHDAPARQVLYTWTTHDQVVALQKGKRLLTREESPTRGAAYLDQVLQALARRGDSIAKILYTSTFARMRYAWHAPFATRRGWPGEQYGDELVRVVLKDNAIILSLFTKTGTFTAHDLAGRSVSLAVVRAAPERIAGIYFVSDASGDPAPALESVPPRTTYREIALCNEWMIESWSVGGPEIERELQASGAAMEALATYLHAEPPPPGSLGPLLLAWEDASDRAPVPLYRAALAFDNELYASDDAAVWPLISLLRATPHTIELQHTPTFPFPGAGIARAGLTIKRAPPGTNSTFGTFGNRNP